MSVEEKKLTVFLYPIQRSLISDTKCLGVFHIPTNSLTPGECPKTQLSFDAMSMVSLQTPQIQTLFPLKHQL
jgi:hypothetical protein